MLARHSICLGLAFAWIASPALAGPVPGMQAWPSARMLWPAPVPDPDMTLERLDNGDMKVTGRSPRRTFSAIASSTAHPGPSTATSRLATKCFAMPARNSNGRTCP